MLLNQKTSEKIWVDEAGNKIPVARLTPTERMREKMAATLLTRAQRLNSDLKALKTLVKDVCDEVYAAFLADNGEKKQKGNITWYNFNRTIKIEVSINERIEFDEMTISLCKDKLMEFIGSSITGTDEFIKNLVLAAFETSRGRLDAKKVLSLKTHKSRIIDKRYHEAMDLLDKAIRRPESKTYFRIWVMNDAGQYENIDLNFSSL